MLIHIYTQIQVSICALMNLTYLEFAKKEEGQAMEDF